MLQGVRTQIYIYLEGPVNIRVGYPRRTSYGRPKRLPLDFPGTSLGRTLDIHGYPTDVRNIQNGRPSDVARMSVVTWVESCGQLVYKSRPTMHTQSPGVSESAAQQTRPQVSCGTGVTSHRPNWHRSIRQTDETEWRQTNKQSAYGGGSCQGPRGVLARVPVCEWDDGTL